MFNIDDEIEEFLSNKHLIKFNIVFSSSHEHKTESEIELSEPKKASKIKNNIVKVIVKKSKKGGTKLF